MGSSKDDRRKPTRRARGVTQDATGQWWAYIYQNGKQHKYRCTSEAAAKAKRKELEQRKEQRVNIRAGKSTLHTWLDHWLQTIIAPNKKPKTYRFYRQVCEQYISPRIGHIKLEKLEADDIRYMLNDLKEGDFAERTIRHAYTVLKTALNQAARDKKILWNPITAVDAPDVAAVKGEPLTDSEASAFIEAVKQHRLYVLYVLAILLGLRKGECLGLRIRDVDLDNATLTVAQQVLDLDGVGPSIEDYTKNNKVRTLPLTPWLVSLLRVRFTQLYAERDREDWDDNGLLFPSERGTPMSERNLDRHFKSACVKAQIRLRLVGKTKKGAPLYTSDLHFHYLRNTCLSWLGSCGINKSIIQAIAGHADKDVTDGYITIPIEAKREALERIEQVKMKRAA